MAPLGFRRAKKFYTLPIVGDSDPDRIEDLSMATINGKPVDTTLYPVVTKGFEYDEVTVPSRFEVELLGAELKRRTIRYRKGQKVACKTCLDFKELEEKARIYGGELAFV
jgi:hypothetical protein